MARGLGVALVVLAAATGGALVYAGMASEERAEHGGRLAAVCEGWCAAKGGAIGFLELSLADPAACGCLIGGRMVFDPRFGERFTGTAEHSPKRVVRVRGW